VQLDPPEDRLKACAVKLRQQQLAKKTGLLEAGESVLAMLVGEGRASALLRKARITARLVVSTDKIVPISRIPSRESEDSIPRARKLTRRRGDQSLDRELHATCA